MVWGRAELAARTESALPPLVILCAWVIEGPGTQKENHKSLKFTGLCKLKAKPVFAAQAGCRMSRENSHLWGTDTPVAVSWYF